MEKHIILAVNPGSTSTKMAFFEDDVEVCRETLHHDASLRAQFPRIWDQFEFRQKAVLEWSLRFARNPHAVVGMGGLLKPLTSGTYRVSEAMIADARANFQGEHASNLGCAMAHDLARHYDVTAYVVDPVSVDEFEDVARYSGHPRIERKTLSHALNIHATARQAAVELGVPYRESAFVVAHLGGGISIAPLLNGRIVDVNDASSDGPFSPERTGGLPLQQFIGLCCSGEHSEAELRTMVMGKGGLMAYLGSNSAVEVERRIADGDANARAIYQAMAYQIAKEIGSMATVLRGSLRAVVLTGGLASSQLLVSWISERVRWIAPVLVYPGENEMRAMALGVLRVLRGDEQALEY
ncbi:MAG: butyrate kinase [Ignavibacteria bacterium]|nr:butyrate kinase [Ignavibacteria bacterium]